MNKIDDAAQEGATTDHPTLFEYLVQFRSELLHCISAFGDSTQGLGWDTSTPNVSIGRELSTIYQRRILLARSFGILCARRHGECGNSNHYKIGPEGYVVVGPKGELIEFKDPKYLWCSQVSQRICDETCPCTKGNTKIPHNIIEEILICGESEEDLRIHVACAFTCLTGAIDNAGNKKPRSGVRENLLKAVMHLNDAIMPVPTERYIREQLAKLKTHF